jgi:hypothetical protein
VEGSQEIVLFLYLAIAAWGRPVAVMESSATSFDGV